MMYYYMVLNVIDVLLVKICLIYYLYQLFIILFLSQQSKTIINYQFLFQTASKKSFLLHFTQSILNKIILLFSLMKKITSQPGLNKRRRSQNQNIQALKIMNFKPQIQVNNPPPKSRQKIMRKREIVQAFNSHIYRQTSKKQEDRRTRSSNGLRIQNQLFGQLKKAEMLNEEMSNLSTVIKEQIPLMNILANRKSVLSKRQDSKETQMIHFTEYVMNSEYPSCSSVLQSRNKKDFSFMKSVKVRQIMNKSAENRSKSQADQLFKSIQLNNSSKYAISRRIMLTGQNINNSFREGKMRGSTAQGSRSYLQQRKSRMRKGHRAVKLDLIQDCKPWQICFPEYCDTDGNIFHL